MAEAIFSTRKCSLLDLVLQFLRLQDLLILLVLELVLLVVVWCCWYGWSSYLLYFGAGCCCSSGSSGGSGHFYDVQLQLHFTELSATSNVAATTIGDGHSQVIVVGGDAVPGYISPQHVCTSALNAITENTNC
jgi:hypothetical protein